MKDGEEDAVLTDEQENVNPTTSTANDRDKKTKERGEKLSDELTVQLARALNGSKEGLSKPKNKIIADFLNKNPTLTKRQVDKRAKEIAINLYLVHPDIFDEFVDQSHPGLRPILLLGQPQEVLPRAQLGARPARRLSSRPDLIQPGAPDHHDRRSRTGSSPHLHKADSRTHLCLQVSAPNPTARSR